MFGFGFGLRVAARACRLIEPIDDALNHVSRVGVPLVRHLQLARPVAPPPVALEGRVKCEYPGWRGRGRGVGRGRGKGRGTDRGTGTGTGTGSRQGHRGRGRGTGRGSGKG